VLLLLFITPLCNDIQWDVFDNARRKFSLICPIPKYLGFFDIVK